MKITIPGNPLATKRVRCGCIQGHGHAYNDPQQTRDMRDVKAIILKQWNEHFDYPNRDKWSESPMLDEHDSYGVVLQFYMPIAKSVTQSATNLMLWGLVPCIDKPDFDNLAKFYCDCATGICWKDDKNITVGISHKIRFSKNPRVEMDIKIHPRIELREIEKAVFKTFSPEELKELSLLAIKLGENYGAFRAYFEDGDQLPYAAFLSETALHVVNLAKYADKLKKVAKQIE